MLLEDIISGARNLAKRPFEIVISGENRKAIFSFGTAFSVSLASAAILSHYMKHEDIPDFSNTAITFLARNAVYFSIYIPLHRALHKQEYKKKIRDERKEMRAISFGSTTGAVSNLILQPFFHYIGLHFLDIEPWLATATGYVLGGGISTYINGAILYKNRVLR